MRHESRAGGGGAVDAVPRHEPERFATLFVDHAPELKRYVVRRLGVEPADDIVAETFAVACSAWTRTTAASVTSVPGCTASPPTSSAGTAAARSACTGH